LVGGSWFSVAFIGSAFGSWDAVNAVNLGVEWEIKGLEAQDELLISVEDKSGRQYPIEPLKGKGSLDFDVRGAEFGKLAVPVAFWGVALFGVSIWGLFQLRKLFDNLARGHYFERINATRVRRMAYAVFGVLGLRLTGQIMFESIFVVQTGSHVSVSGVEIGISPLLISGLVLLVLSQVLKEAAVLKEEQDLTV
ncbi:MAG: DUF2975 domain-containing protein, partial [Verrucomicrobiota bacterium]